MAADTAVLEHLHDLLPNFDKWIGQIEDRHAVERQRLAQVAERAQAERDATASAVGKHERHYRDLLERDDRKADLALEFVEEARRELADAELRLEASQCALASVPEEIEHDRMLDFACQLRDTIRGKVAGTRTTEQVNRALHGMFTCSSSTRPATPYRKGVGYELGAVRIEPSIRPEVAHVHMDPESWPPPPMEWVKALDQSTSHISAKSHGRRQRSVHYS